MDFGNSEPGRLVWQQAWQVTLLIPVVWRLCARNRPYLAHMLCLLVMITPKVIVQEEEEVLNRDLRE
ncbi:MAG: hypothetical protein CMJ48_05885 [Planctomycetaceae bacterium]|nr:hypothetical protein [Planctomycetaceae bacterium]